MKKFNFSLQKVLEIKEQFLENLKIELSNLNYEYIKNEKLVINLKDEYEIVNDEFNEKSCVAISVGEIIYYKIHMSSILKQIENKEEEKRALNKNIEAKRQEIINMNIEISTLEKLREKEIEKYNKVLLKKEEIFIEEFIVNKVMTEKFAI